MCARKTFLIVSIIACLTISCQKSNKSNPSPLIYAKDIAGMYHWTGTLKKHYFNQQDSTFPVSYDFPIEVISDSIILVGLDSSTLYYDPILSDSILHYNSYESWPRSPYDSFLSRDIYYNYWSKKVTFRRLNALPPANSVLLGLESN